MAGTIEAPMTEQAGAPSRRKRAVHADADTPAGAASVPAGAAEQAGSSRRRGAVSVALSADAQQSVAAPITAPSARGTVRRTNGRARVVESNIVGLAERARVASAAPSLLAIPDALALALPGLRHVLLDRPFDEAVRVVAEGFAAALAPAEVQIWIAEPAPWAGDQTRAGGQELVPSLRPCAVAVAPGSAASDDTPVPAAIGRSLEVLIADVIDRRRSVVLLEGEPASGTEHASRAPLGAAEQMVVGTLAAHPLRARGQFL
ncbi:MAG: hypothetical protein ACHQ4H_04245, partial [Ktedonobacterales bacterium]